jgi:hypothetical protein
MVILQQFPAVPSGAQNGLEVVVIMGTPSVALIFMWWSWIRDLATPHVTPMQRRTLFCAALLVTTSDAFFWALAAHNLLPRGHRIRPPDTLLLKGLAAAMLGIMVAFFGKGRRTVALTVTAGIAAFLFWAVFLIVSGAGVF